jgi:polyisoprenoid-binding protein YceI
MAAMPLPTLLRRPWTWVAAGIAAVLLVAVVAPFVYINFIQDDPPPRLTFEDSPSTSAASSATTNASTETTVAASTAPATAAETAASDLDGAWAVADGSLAGYRVGEVLFGQDTEAVGRTSDITGQMSISGTTIESGDFTVDLTTVTSDESRRDGQFQGRIMDTTNFPTATFALSQPIELADVPDDLEEVTVQATGDFTIRGVTQPVTFDLTARRNGTTIEVNGAIPITFSDYGIPDASFGPAQVQGDGEIEFLLVFSQA